MLLDPLAHISKRIRTRGLQLCHLRHAFFQKTVSCSIVATYSQLQRMTPLDHDLRASREIPSNSYLGVVVNSRAHAGVATFLTGRMNAYEYVGRRIWMTTDNF